MLLRVVLVILINIGTAVTSVAGVKKCCRKGEVVHVDSIEDNNLSPRKLFSCVEESKIRTKVKSKRESEGYEFLNSSMVSEMIAYNILIDENTNWPSCSDNGFMSYDLIKISKRISESASCVDIMSNDYFIFSCQEKSDTMNDFTDVYRLRKCCEKNFSYDIFLRRCVNASSINNNPRDFLRNKIVVFESGIPQCKSDDVLVEYHSLVHKLKIYESSLVITNTNNNGPDLLTQDTYCIDNTYNSEVELPDGTDPEIFRLKALSTWIAKVCRPKTICSQIPCVRKCCKEGQRMVFDNETYCENHESHLYVKFHFFDIKESPENPKLIEPTGECSRLIVKSE